MFFLCCVTPLATGITESGLPQLRLAWALLLVMLVASVVTLHIISCSKTADIIHHRKSIYSSKDFNKLLTMWRKKNIRCCSECFFYITIHMAWYNCTIGANYTTKTPFQLHKLEPNYPKLQCMMYVHYRLYPKLLMNRWVITHKLLIGRGKC